MKSLSGRGNNLPQETGTSLDEELVCPDTLVPCYSEMLKGYISVQVYNVVLLENPNKEQLHSNTDCNKP